MLPTKSNRSYSEFFTSGFHSMTSHSARRASAMPSPSTTMTPDDSIATSSTKRRRHSFIDFTKRRSRPSSLILSPALSVKSGTSSSHEQRRSSQSSLITFSSWLFDRKITSRSDNYLSFSSSPPKNKRELFKTSELMEVRITAGGPYSPTSHRIDADDSNSSKEIDPFSSSPDSKSFFIDLTDSPLPSSPTKVATKRESFLSLSGSSDRSFFRLRFPRRERPTSIHTMPLPSRSRRSSYQAASRDRSIYSVDEESRVVAPEPTSADPEEWSDPAQHIDWREFHVEVLCEGERVTW